MQAKELLRLQDDLFEKEASLSSPDSGSPESLGLKASFLGVDGEALSIPRPDFTIPTDSEQYQPSPALQSAEPTLIGNVIQSLGDFGHSPNPLTAQAAVRVSARTPAQAADPQALPSFESELTHAQALKKIQLVPHCEESAFGARSFKRAGKSIGGHTQPPSLKNTTSVLRQASGERTLCLYTPHFTGQDPATHARQMLALAEACLRFTPQIALREGEAIFLEIGKSHRLFSEDSLRRRTAVLAKRLGLNVTVVVESDPGSALARARWGLDAGQPLPIEALPDYICPFFNLSEESWRNSSESLSTTRPKGSKRRYYELSRQTAQIITWLKQLGIQTLEQYQELPIGQLASRFGAAAVRAHCDLKAYRSQPWPRFIPSERIEAEFDFDYELAGLPAELGRVSNLEPIFFVLKRLLDPLTLRLRGRMLKAAKLKLVIEQEKLSTVTSPMQDWVFRFALPQGTTPGILSILRDRLQHDLSQNPLEACVQKIRIEILDTIISPAYQRHFFHQHDDHQLAWEIFWGRMSERVGAQNIYYAQSKQRHVPESAWQKFCSVKQDLSLLPDVDQDPHLIPSNHATPPVVARLKPATHPPTHPTTTPFKTRPTQLLPRPQSLVRRQDFLYCPKLQLSWQANEWIGPEKIFGEWWFDRKLQGKERSYYRVRTTQDELLWVFSLPQQGELFEDEQQQSAPLYLHGFFD